jgi:polar amino acid transport system permease protein
MLNDLRAWGPDLWAGVQLTVLLTVLGMALALVLGLVVALMRLSPRIALSWPAIAFVEVIRGSPLILQLFYIYYVMPLLGLRLTPLQAGLAGLAINYGAYLSEVFRAGIAAIPRSQHEASAALGLRPRQAMRLVILPQAIRIVVPPVGNYFISMFKDTALVSTISIAELMFSGQLIASDTFKYMQVYSIVFMIYLAISIPASLGVRWLERRLDPAQQQGRLAGKIGRKALRPAPL